MKLKIALFLLVCGMVFPNFDKTRDDCIAKCRSRCTATLETCKQNAKSKTAVEGCQKSYNICASNCVNKACPSASAPTK